MSALSFALDDTIAAVATPEGGAGEGILRLSGPASWTSVADRLVPLPKTPPSPIPPEKPWIVSTALRIWEDAAPAPCTLCFWPRGRGYTSQETVELHLPGCVPLLQALLSQLVSSERVRLAGPGEFTLRAFLAGRLDLTQAEAVLGVIDAENRQGLQTALAQLAGGIAFPLKDLRDSLLEMLAHLEAGIDFAEEDIQFVEPEVLARFLLDARRRVGRLRERLARRASSDTLPTVVILGATNAGKSRLFNALISCHGDATSSLALVSDTPGTTRDYIEAELNWDGAGFRLLDTAGLGKEFDTLPDRQAQEFSEKLAAEADVRLFCVEAARETPDTWEKRFLREHPDRLLLVRTKTDSGIQEDESRKSLHNLLYSNVLHHYESFPGPCETVWTSALTGLGLAELRRRIVALVSEPAGSSEVVPATALRCVSSLRRAWEALSGALHLLGMVPPDSASDDATHSGENDPSPTFSGNYDESLVAAELRLALDALAEVAGTVYTDDILDRIFSRFCIGK